MRRKNNVGRQSAMMVRRHLVVKEDRPEESEKRSERHNMICSEKIDAAKEEQVIETDGGPKGHEAKVDGKRNIV